MSSFTLKPDLYASCDAEIRVNHCYTPAQLLHLLPAFLDSVENGTVGLAPSFTSKSQLARLAIATHSQVLILDLACIKTSSKNKTTIALDRLKNLLLDPDTSKYAYEMEKTATGLFMDWALRIASGKDLLELSAHGDCDRYSFSARILALGGQGVILSPKAVGKHFPDEGVAQVPVQTLALQAWSAGYSASLAHVSESLKGLLPINTQSFEEKSLRFICKVVRDAARMRALKPIRTKNEVDKKGIFRPDKIGLTSKRYSSRVNARGSQMVKVTIKHPTGKLSIVVGKGGSIDGRASDIKVSNNITAGAVIQSVETIGREQQTLAERLRTSTMLRILQHEGSSDLLSHAFIVYMWSIQEDISWAGVETFKTTPALNFPTGKQLNASQKKAVEATLSRNNSSHTVVIHGPPGTGKTTVIAAIVNSIIASSDETRTVWLVAQSNVAVKNIAEKLASIQFYDFKLLVSYNFHHDWHEHLYEKISANIIRSDEFENTHTGVARQLLGSRVILCTLGMLSNDKLLCFSQVVPLQTVIFDEASQIEIGDYLPMLMRFRSTLRQLVFIGDHKQLAPYGSSDIPELESVFEKPHLKAMAIFLEMQYRMPTPIGDFISERVYDRKLHSQHAITDPGVCCRFVDVYNGSEEKHGHSWKNLREVSVVIATAKQLFSQKKSFRIITPYDAQRSLLEVGLQKAELPWENKCFNIDAFQGNEDDFIIISVVRSKALGFLKEIRRVNVMLTRCKKGMAICTSRKFVKGPAANSLIGKLCCSFPDSTWVKADQILDQHVSLFPA